MNKTAIVSGANGQDGSYLCEYLLEKDYHVVGLHRRSSSNTLSKLCDILHHPNFTLKEADIVDASCVTSVVNEFLPDEFYNLAAQSHVATSFKQPTLTMDINTSGVINILEAIRRFSPNTKFYQASTSEMFGRNYTTDDQGNKYQDETTELMPQSPYGVAKLASHRLVQIYREAYGIFGCSGILFNHESPRRGENFVTRKITKYIGQVINHEINEPLKLGNLYAKRDWGHAKDYVRAMHMMLQNETPDDYVVATGHTHSIIDFLNAAFNYCGLNQKDYVQVDPELYRPAEVEYLKGNANKANSILGWYPEISFDDLVIDMVESDIDNAKKLLRS